MLQTHFLAVRPRPHCQVESFYRLLVEWQIWSEQTFCATLTLQKKFMLQQLQPTVKSAVVRWDTWFRFRNFSFRITTVCSEGRTRAYIMCQRMAWKSHAAKHSRQLFRKIKKFLLKTMAENIVHKSKWKLKGCTASSYYTNTYQNVRGDLILVYKVPMWESDFWEYCHLNSVGKDSSTKRLKSEARSKTMQHQR